MKLRERERERVSDCIERTASFVYITIIGVLHGNIEDIDSKRLIYWKKSKTE